MLRSAELKKMCDYINMANSEFTEFVWSFTSGPHQWEGQVYS